MIEKPSYKELENRVKELELAFAENKGCEIAKSEALFRGLFDNMTSGSAIYEVINDGSKGSDYIIKEFNKTSLNMEGKTLEQVMGKSLYDLRPTIDEYGLIPVLKNVWETGNPAYYPIKIYQDENFSNYYENYIFKIPSGEIVTIYNDVTEQKINEIALKESTERFELALKFANDGLYDWNPTTNEIYYSNGWKRMLGYEPHEIKNDFSEWDRLTRPEDVQASWEMLNEVIGKKRHRFEKEFQMRHKNGHWVDILSRANVVFDKRGTAVRVVGTHIDITERKRSEAALKAIEWLLSKSVGNLSQSPQEYGDLTELNKERLILDAVDREVIADIVKGYLDLLETSAAVYERNGGYAHGIFASGWCRMLDSASRKLCGTNDNGEALASGKWLCHESCWTDVSKVCIQTGEPVDMECRGGLRIYSVPIKVDGEIVGAINFGHGDPPKNLPALVKIAEKYKIEIDNLVKEANLYESRPAFIVEIAKNRLRSSARLIGAMIESRLSQAELEKEKDKLRITLRSIGDGVITADTSGKVVIINKVAENLTGWTQKEAVGKNLEEIFHIVNERTRKRCENPVAKVLETNTIVGLANDTVLISRDGTEKIIADSGSPIIDGFGNTIGVVLVFRDITEKVALEAELQHARKMEAIGHLAGGIAHEFNNVLGIIIGNAELAVYDLEKWHPVAENLNEIKLAGLRAKDVVKQLLSFSRKMEMKREPIDVKIIVKESLKLLRASIPSSIRIREYFPEEIDSVVADPTQIHQLLINLCNNAAHAMNEEGGCLTIGLGNVELDFEAASKHPDLKPGSYVLFSVSDTGYGIPSNMLDKIFEPYFTTKEVGKGTGLGLAVVHGIVKAHNGAIGIESSVGEGTAFHIYFPSSKAATNKKEKEKILFPAGTEKILFVDDEESIVKLYAKILPQWGYTVYSDTDPVKILDRFQSDPFAYDLVISDMTMPNLTGDRLAKELLKIRPDIPIIICTGFHEKISPEKIEEMGIKGLLMKPIETAKLSAMIKEILDEAKGGIRE